jgi:hypothetical protein
MDAAFKKPLSLAEHFWTRENCLAGGCNTWKREEPMSIWAAVIALVLGCLAYFTDDPSTMLFNVAELGAVIGVFALVCAAEAWN